MTDIKKHREGGYLKTTPEAKKEKVVWVFIKKASLVLCILLTILLIIWTSIQISNHYKEGSRKTPFKQTRPTSLPSTPVDVNKVVSDTRSRAIEIYAENAPADYIEQECLPILNDIVDSLNAAKYKFPELSQLERRHIKKPFGQFLYQFRVEAIPRKKAMRIAPGGCSISLFLEPFTRKKTGKEGRYTTSSSHSKIYPHKDFDDLAIRLNYELRVGTPNEDLQELFSTLLKQGISELGKKAEAFRRLKNGASPE